VKAMYKVGDGLRLKKDVTFTRTFPQSGRNKDGTVGEADKTLRGAGDEAKVYKIYETSASKAQASYDLDFGDFRIHLKETELLELFDAD
jgi:hypothetical protein